MIFKVETIKAISMEMFQAAGATEQKAQIVTDELVEASLMGLDSHGIMRIAQYLTQVKEGQIKPNMPVETIYETANSAIVDCNYNFGMVCAVQMAEIVVEKAKKNRIAVVASRHCNHIGRLGSYTQKIANEGLFGFAMVNSSRHGHFVAPFGGTEGRLATNPLSYAVPTTGDPIVLDMSTSMIAEGKIRIMLQQGEKLPDYCVLDAQGNNTNEPAEFYGPPKGTILPLGGVMGYKGFGLGLLVELLGSTISGVPLTKTGEKDEYVNGLFLMAINPDIFGAEESFVENIDTVKEYILSSKSQNGTKGVVMPGELDFKTRSRRLQHGIEVEVATWESIVEAGKLFGVDLSGRIS